MGNDIKIFQCSHIGVSGTTDVHVRKSDTEKYEARVGIALLGSTNMDAEGFKKCNSNPFHELFNDNYAFGIGKTEAEAIEKMRLDMNDISESIWRV